ncbi:UNVERIFIED_ORG: hypothetical protein M2420_000377 [Stenotrophomonas maltophilia]|uniref:hypothetical protein n=1 Tax=Stenotrophomonas indicatrix TaxID=2045451 RepID=UPI000B44B62F
MSTKSQRLQNIIKLYKQRTGNSSVIMQDVAKFAAEMGWQLPKPKDPIDLLAEELSKAAREEIRKDEVTGRPYRANLAVTTSKPDGTQFTFWTDIDEAPRHVAHRSFTQRRDQMIGDALQLTFDATHWNRVHADEEPINMVLDFTDDVEERMTVLDVEDNAA